jgi:hypothetical protein
MPHGQPPFVVPWSRQNWHNLQKGKRLYAVQEWQCWLIRNGNPVPDLPDHVANALNIPVTWYSTKAINMLRQWFPQDTNQEAVQETENREPKEEPVTEQEE